MVLKLFSDHYKNKDIKMLCFDITLVTYCKLLNHNEMEKLTRNYYNISTHSSSKTKLTVTNLNKHLKCTPEAQLGSSQQGESLFYPTASTNMLSHRLPPQCLIHTQLIPNKTPIKFKHPH